MARQEPSYPTISMARAGAHEALFLRLSALAEQCRLTAVRYPDRAVPAEILALAEALLAEAAQFRPNAGRRERLPMPAPVWAGLFGQVGQALAGLEAFETRYSQWNDDLKGRVWRLKRGPLPVGRLREPVRVASRRRYHSKVQRLLEERINAITKGDAPGT